MASNAQYAPRVNTPSLNAQVTSRTIPNGHLFDPLGGLPAGAVQPAGGSVNWGSQPNALQAGPAPAAQQPAPAMSASPDYVGQFNSSLADARQNIANQLGSALNEISANRGRSQQAIGLLPGQYNQIFGNAANQANAETQTMQAAVAKSGGSYDPSGVMGPVNAARGSIQAGEMANVPVLSLGANNEYDRQQLQAQLASAANNQQLGQEQRGFLGGQANAATANQYALGQQGQYQANALTAQTQHDAALARLYGAGANQYAGVGQNEVSAIHGQQISQSPLAGSIRQDPWYQGTMNYINGNQKFDTGNGKTATMTVYQALQQPSLRAQALNDVSQRAGHHARTASLAMFDMGIPQK